MKTKALFKNMYVRNSYGLSLGIIAFSFVIAFVGLRDSGGVLIMHFSNFRGIDFLGSRTDVLSILLAGCAITVINFLLTKEFFARFQFLALLIAFFNVFLVTLIFISVAVIITVN